MKAFRPAYAIAAMALLLTGCNLEEERPESASARSRNYPGGDGIHHRGNDHHPGAGAAEAGRGNTPGGADPENRRQQAVVYYKERVFRREILHRGHFLHKAAGNRRSPGA